MKIHFEIKKLILKETFSIAHGNYNYRNSLLIQLSHDGKMGFGESVEIDYYGINFQDFLLKTKEIQSRIEDAEIVHPSTFFNFLKTLVLHPFLQSAFDCAYWDLYGKLEGKSFAELNEMEVHSLPESSITISIQPIDEQIKKINNSDWGRFKVKCKGFKKDDAKKLVGLNKKIALDANSSFSPEDCTWMQENLQSDHLLYVEQPLEIGNYHFLERNDAINWLADEDFQKISDLEKLKNHYSSVNIKVMKCGGLTPSLKIIEEAKKHGFQIMVGCMTESSVGISAGIAIAPLCDFADLDGAELISNDYAEGSFVKNGTLYLSQNPGLGISLKPIS